MQMFNLKFYFLFCVDVNKREGWKENENFDFVKK